MYGVGLNSNVDTKTTVELDNGRRFRVHQTGYIEGDTNGFVEGKYEIFELDEDGNWYKELSIEEGTKFFDPLYIQEPEFMSALLFGRKGRKAFNCYIRNSREKAFRFKKKFWRVYKLEHIERDENGFSSVGYCNNYKGIYHLVSFGAITLFEAIDDLTENAKWKKCNCSDYDPY